MASELKLSDELSREPFLGQGQAQATSMTLNAAMEHVGFGRFQWRLLLVTGATQLADAMELLLVTFLPRAIRCDGSFAGRINESALSTSVFCGMLFGAGAGKRH